MNQGMKRLRRRQWWGRKWTHGLKNKEYRVDNYGKEGKKQKRPVSNILYDKNKTSMSHYDAHTYIYTHLQWKML